MAMQQLSENELMTDINITPLVDIMLVLLITFMLVSTVMDVKLIKVELPQADTGNKADQETVAILISKDNELSMAGRPIASIDALKAALKTKKEENPGFQAVISADRRVYHGQVVQVIDVLRALSVGHFAIQVEPFSETAIQ